MVDLLHWCATVPGGDWRVPAPRLWVMVMFYLGVPLVVDTVQFRYHRIIGAGLIVMALGGWIVSGSPRSDGDQWRVTFLDVGQGDSAALQLPDGKTVLIDGGKRYERFDMGRGVIVPFLLNQGIRRLDHIIATHPQQDHVGGLPWMIRHLEVGDFWHTSIDRPEPLFEELRQAVKARNIHDHVAIRGAELTQGDFCRMTVLNPIGTPSGRSTLASSSGTFLNNASVVTQLFCGRHTILFAADIETEGLHHLTAFGQDPVTLKPTYTINDVTLGTGQLDQAAIFAAARQAGLFIIHTREGHRPDLSDLQPSKKARGKLKTGIGDKGPMGRILVRGEYGHDIIDELKPRAGEPVLDKPGKGAFYATDFDAILKHRGMKQLVVCGVTTEVCVQTTVREANDRGFECLILGDCTAATDHGNHLAALKMVTMQGGVFGAVADSGAVIAAIGGGAA